MFFLHKLKYICAAAQAINPYVDMNINEISRLAARVPYVLTPKLKIPQRSGICSAGMN